MKDISFMRTSGSVRFVFVFIGVCVVVFLFLGSGGRCRGVS